MIEIVTIYNHFTTYPKSGVTNLIWSHPKSPSSPNRRIIFNSRNLSGFPGPTVGTSGYRKEIRVSYILYPKCEFIIILKEITRRLFKSVKGTSLRNIYNFFFRKWSIKF